MVRNSTFTSLSAVDLNLTWFGRLGFTSALSWAVTNATSAYQTVTSYVPRELQGFATTNDGTINLWNLSRARPDNHDEDQEPVFDWRNPYGFTPADNAHLLTYE